MSKRRTLSTLEGCPEAARELLNSGQSCFHKGHLRSVGAWVPPRSIQRVTISLVRALALCLVRQENQIEAERNLRKERQGTVIQIWEARLYRERARGKFRGE